MPLFSLNLFGVGGMIIFHKIFLTKLLNILSFFSALTCNINIAWYTPHKQAFQGTNNFRAYKGPETTTFENPLL